jgi:general secretion pathway protein D
MAVNLNRSAALGRMTFASFLIISSCQSAPAQQDPASPARQAQGQTIPAAEAEGRPEPETASDLAGGSSAGEPVRDTFDVPSIASGIETSSADLLADAPRPKPATVDAFVEELPLPDFINVVFGEMLQVPFYTGPGIAEQKNTSVILKTSGPLKSDDFLELVIEVLKSYGVAVVPEKKGYQILGDASLKAQIPRFIRSRATFDTPASLRPVVMFVELDAIAANDMASILKQAFPGKDSLQVEANPRSNVVTLSGLPDDVEAGLRIIDEMDELIYAGTKMERYSPQFRMAPELAKEVSTMLSVEGWQSSDNPSVQRTILIVPIPFTNDVFIFSRSDIALSRARFHISQLDRPSRSGEVPELFVYNVQNVDAEILATTVNALLSGRSISPAVGMPADAPGSGSLSVGGDLAVDRMSNRIIYSGTASDFARLKSLLTQMDQSPGEVLIQVTIAEITLTDETEYGLEFFIDSIGNSDALVNLGSAGNSLGSSGLSVGFVSGNVEAALNAFASNSQVRVLSKPRLIARSGGAARIQVGNDVPVITSQRAASEQSGGGELDVLQSVEYRKTGVLLTIEPIIFSRNRVDLTISQEVSTVLPTTTSNISSPTISNRTLDTQLSVEDGETIVLGGLIQNNTTEAESGIPLLKDLPFAGHLFKSTSLSQTRTELLVLITAYVLRDRNDKSAATESLVQSLQNTAGGSIDLQTLLPSSDSIRAMRALELIPPPADGERE